MAASETFIVPGEGSSTAASPVPVAPGPVAVAPRWPRLIPAAQLFAVVLGVLAIIWNQQQTTDSLRTELRDEISRVETGLRAEITGLRAEIASLRDEISRVETGLRAEITGLRAEITGLRAEIDGVETSLGEEMAGLRSEVRSNGERLARIEGFLGIGIPETATPP